MGPHRIVILQVALEDVVKVLLARHHDMIQAFSANRADQTLRISVLPRGPCRSGMTANAKQTTASNEYIAVTRTPTADQIAGDLPPATGGRQLIGDPLRRWVSGDAEPQDLSPAMADHQQSIEK